MPDEVVITVAESSDDSLGVAHNWRPKGIKVQAISIPGSATRSTGRNRAVDAASGTVVCFTDAGCQLSASWLESIIHAFSLSGVQLVSGYTRGAETSPAEEVQSAFVLVSREKIGTHPLPATRNMAVRVSAWQEIGPFRDDLNYAEDFEWSRRAELKGFQSVFVPDAEVVWTPRTTALAYWRMIFHLTRGDMLAATWRWGHASMWMRYLFFLAVTAFLLWRTNSVFWSVFALFLVLSAYIGIKGRRFRFRFAQSWLLYPWYQFMTDTAVLSGTLTGLMQRLYNQRQDRSTHA
ncbi:glycosyltransferase [Candidatus Woesebacteria bacterium]|nr:glycosyltransferase [Candidatus Woesebacteria bacterium]MCD8527547.1 glycosyltransferase [Candidatus Woesebacteria bacterium]